MRVDLGVEDVAVVWGLLNLAFDVGGFFSCFACTSSVFDILDVFEKIDSFFFVVSGAGSERLWE